MPEDSWHELGRRGTQAAVQLAVRSLLVRGLALAGTLVLARLLSPEDFGVFAIVVFVISLWSALGDFGLGAALVQQDSEPTRQQLATAWTAQQAISLVAVGSAWLAAPWLARLAPGLPADAEWMIRLLSFGLLLASLRTLPAVMMERQLRFGPLAAAEVVQSVTYYALAIGLAILGARAWSFVLAGLAQLTVGAVVVNLAWGRRPPIGIDRASLRALVGFGLHFQLGTLFVSFRDSPLPVVAGVTSGAEAAGLLGFTTRVAFTISSIEEIVGRIAFPAFSRLQGRPAEQARALDSAIMLTALAVAPLQCWLAATAPYIVPLAFGDRWQAAVVPIQMICVAMVLRFPTRYIRQAVFASGRSGLGLRLAAAETMLALVCFTAGFLLGQLDGGAAGFLVGAALGLAITAMLARPVVRPRLRPFILMLGSLTFSAVAAAAVAAAADRIVLTAFSGPWAAAVAAAAIGSMAFAALALALLTLTSRPTLTLGWQLARRSIAPDRG
jgi:O-antigen/teichoic acid export membrane protein